VSASFKVRAISSPEVSRGPVWESPCSSCMHGLPTATVVAAATSVASISSRMLGDKVVSRTGRASRANLNTRAAGQTVSVSIMQCGTQLLGVAGVRATAVFVRTLPGILEMRDILGEDFFFFMSLDKADCRIDVQIRCWLIQTLGNTLFRHSFAVTSLVNA